MKKTWDWASRGTPSENEDWDIFFGADPYGGVVMHRGRAYTITTDAKTVSAVADEEFGNGG